MAEAFLVQADNAGGGYRHLKQQAAGIHASYMKKHTEYTGLQLELRREVPVVQAVAEPGFSAGAVVARPCPAARMRELLPLMRVEHARFSALSRMLQVRDVSWLYGTLRNCSAAERAARLSAARASYRYDPKQLDQLHALQEAECPVEARDTVALSIVASQLPSCKSATVVRVPAAKAIDAETLCTAISEVLPIDRQTCLELHGIVRPRRSSSDVPWSSQMESTRLNPVHLCGPNLAKAPSALQFSPQDPLERRHMPLRQPTDGWPASPYLSGGTKDDPRHVKFWLMQRCARCRKLQLKGRRDLEFCGCLREDAPRKRAKLDEALEDAQLGHQEMITFSQMQADAISRLEELARRGGADPDEISGAKALR